MFLQVVVDVSGVVGSDTAPGTDFVIFCHERAADVRFVYVFSLINGIATRDTI